MAEFFDSENMCVEFNRSWIFATLFQYLVSVIIVILNTVIKAADIQIVKKIGMVNRSMEISLIFIAVFVS